MKTKTTYALLLWLVANSLLAQSDTLNTKLVLAQDDMRLKN